MEGDHGATQTGVRGDEEVSELLATNLTNDHLINPEPLVLLNDPGQGHGFFFLHAWFPGYGVKVGDVRLNKVQFGHVLSNTDP